MPVEESFLPKMEDVVVSGMSGRFPECSNMEEFRDSLFSGVDLVTEDDRRWPLGMHGLPTRNGKLKEISKFDATFFGVHAKQAEVMDPQLRLLLELTHEAILDAGINPQELRGSKTGVYVGQTFSEAQEYVAADPDGLTGYGLLGTSRAQIANRISFTFDFKGPSYNVDTACSSALFAYQHAVDAIEKGDIDYAIVGGINLLLKPETSLQFHKLSMLSSSGTCKAFDASGSGYVRSEAACVSLLQRAGTAKRIYATTIKIKTNTDGYKDLGITFPSGQMQKALIEDVFREISVLPNEISYVEAHGTGTKAGDPQEVNTIADVFCAGKQEALLIGSVKSNMGHSEAAAGLCSLAKVIIAMEEGKIPQNLHFKEPNPDIPALHDGRLQVVDLNWPWKGGYVAINSFGFGGANAHLVLKSNKKPKKQTQNNLQKLVAVSGRTEDAVLSFLQKIEKNKNDDEFIALIHDIHKMNISGHNYRGFTILGSNKHEIEECSKKREIWFVFSGMGSQWSGMGKGLMTVEPFSNAIHKCADVLAKEGLDLMSLINDSDEKTFENVVNSFVCIAAIQVALVDVLDTLGVRPDGILGHSVGELGCAYADGTFTAEQTVLAAYARGKCILETKLGSQIEDGAMAAVGMTWEETKRRLPEDLVAACHNSKDSVTISGPEGLLTKFVSELEKEGIFARKVNSSGFAFHSKYIAVAGPNLKRSLDKIVSVPKPRTKRWISTSIPEDNWNTDLAQNSSSEYHVNNLLSPVLFHEGLEKVPEDSIIVEIAPHALLQAILKRSKPKCSVLGLTKRNIPDVNFLMNQLGKLYNSGVPLNLAKLYPKVSFPVGRGTAMISPMIQWDHSVDWEVPLLTKVGGKSGESVIEVDLSKSDGYITGHTIDGRILYPATGYLVLVWKTFAKLQGRKMEDTPVVLDDVHLKRATIMPKEGTVKFSVNIFNGSGNFEVLESNSVVVNGRIANSKGMQEDGLDLEIPFGEQRLTSEEFYKDLHLRGYEYKNDFKVVQTTDGFGTTGVLNWENNWVTFMDAMLQFSISSLNTRELYLPTRIQKVIIDPTAQNGNPQNVFYYKNLAVIKSGGVEIRNLKTSLARKRASTQPHPKHERYTFTPYLQTTITKEDALTSALQIVAENSGALKLKIIEIAKKDVLAKEIYDILSSEPQISCDITVISELTEVETNGIKYVKKDPKMAIDHSFHLVVASDPSILTSIEDSLKPGSFLLCDNLKSSLETIGSYDCGEKTLLLLRKLTHADVPKVIEITNQNFEWVEDVKMAMNESQKVILVARDPHCGLIGMVNCLKQEPGGENIRSFFINDGPTFDLENPTYKNQLKKDLLVNILKDGIWGSLRHFRLDRNNDEVQVEHAYINTLVRGDLSSLTWIQGPLSYKKDAKLCHVYYAPLNFRDIMLATGKLPPDALPGDLASQECILGMEFSGRDHSGKRVMGIVEACGLATTLIPEKGFLWDVPHKWTLEEASTVPIVYATAYYALIVRGRLKQGESVLIHAGTGGVGQAAISIALHMNCNVFVTVGTDQKRKFLTENFPKLDPKNIGNSRNTSFEQLVLNETKGQGVHVVLNSLAGEQLLSSVRCLAKHGRFLEIGKLDLSENSPLGMAVLLKNTSVHGILLDSLFTAKENWEKQKVIELMKEGIASGVVKPLPCTTFNHDQIEQSFRYMATGKHIGKVVLKIRDESMKTPLLINAIGKTYMHSEKTYILVGGLGGFGLELANWLIEKGATKIVLVSRSGISNGYQWLCVRRWQEKGINVSVMTVDCTNQQGAQLLINEANKIGPVGGIFNLAAVLKDAYMENLTQDDFKKVCRAKIDATECLDKASRNCKFLDHFVTFSSVSCGRGNAGQANYGMANSAMERICESRKAERLPGMAIQWGAIGDVGLVLRDMKGDNETIVGGTLPQRIQSCLLSMDFLLRQNHPVVASMVLAEKGKSASSTQIGLVDAIANILGMKDTKSAGTSTLSDLGMDSLMGAEIKQTLERNYDLVMNAQEIRSLTFAKLQELSSGEIVENGLHNEHNVVENMQLLPQGSIREINKKDGRKVFFVHPIEGNVTMLEEVASGVSANVWGLECSREAPLESLNHLASYYIQSIRAIQPEGPYSLVGYSFGAGVAFEMGLQLESLGQKVSLVLIDGSPDFTRNHIDVYKKTKGLDKDFEAFKLAYISMLFFKKDFNSVQKDLFSISKWDDRVEYCARIMPDYDKSDIVAAANSFGQKLTASYSYKPNSKFKGPVELLKASESFVDLGQDYDLGKYCQRKVDIITIHGSHQTILKGESAKNISNVINRNLKTNF